MSESVGKSVWMTDDQLFGLFDELGVIRVFRPAGGRIMLVLGQEDKQETVTVSDLKARSLTAIRELEEQRQEVSDNYFAQPLNGGLSVGGVNTIPVQFLKRDDQLSEEECKKKALLLEKIDADISLHRVIIAGMNHLQVNFKELGLRLLTRETPVEQQPAAAPHAGSRLLWTKGIKSAALMCLKESRRADSCGKSELDVCREFLTKYVFEEDEDYTPHHLFLNIQQIKLLDQTD